MDTFPLVTIIILNWNGKKDTVECLDSLKEITYPNYEITLVDNGSVDGSVEFVKKKYPEVEIIESIKNLGFAEGNNVAIRKAVERGTDYILMLNNDTVVDPEFLRELVKVLENDSSVGIAGPTVYYYKEKDRIQSAGGKICFYRGQTPHLTSKNDIKLNEIRDVDYIMGCALLTKCELFKKIGYLNKDYFAYWEETDWCIRAKKAGYRIVHAPVAKVWHKGGSTTQKTRGFYEYQMTRNMFWFMKTHASTKQYLVFLIYFFGFQFWYSSTIHILYHKNIQAYRSFLKGIVDGAKRVY
jgi:GT2 family glycosyltransferase